MYRGTPWISSQSRAIRCKNWNKHGQVAKVTLVRWERISEFLQALEHSALCNRSLSWQEDRRWRARLRYKKKKTRVHSCFTESLLFLFPVSLNARRRNYVAPALSSSTFALSRFSLKDAKKKKFETKNNTTAFPLFPSSILTLICKDKKLTDFGVITNRREPTAPSESPGGACLSKNPEILRGIRPSLLWGKGRHPLFLPTHFSCMPGTLGRVSKRRNITGCRFWWSSLRILDGSLTFLIALSDYPLQTHASLLYQRNYY